MVPELWCDGSNGNKLNAFFIFLMEIVYYYYSHFTGRQKIPILQVDKN